MCEINYYTHSVHCTYIKLESWFIYGLRPFNPNRIGVKYSLTVFGGGQFTPCLCVDLLIDKKNELKLYVFVIIKSVLNGVICF